MPVATQTPNGVDVTRLVATIDAIKENPDLARFQFRSQSRWPVLDIVANRVPVTVDLVA